MTEDLQNQSEDTAVEAETQDEQGTVVDDMVDTADAETTPVVEDGSEDKEAQKAKMRENQLNNIESKARELEQETGLSLEDLLFAARSESDAEEEEAVSTPATSEEFDKELFDKLVDARFKEKYGSKLEQLDKFGQYAAKIEAKEIVSKLPADYKEYEADIAAFLKKNPVLSKIDSGVETAYYAVKGMKSNEIASKAVSEKEKETNQKEEQKDISFVESSKTERDVKVSKDIQDYLNLSTDEFAKLPNEIREQILRSIS